MTRRIAIVGGGVTGLTAAKVLADRVASQGLDVEVVLLERSARLGGNLVGERHEGFLLDGGPDSWVVTKPHASALAKDLGLEGELMPTLEGSRRVYIAWNGALHPLPEGLVLAVPTEIAPIVRTPLFSLAAKARMGLEPFVPRKRWDSEDDDESVADFVTRRLGREVTDRLAGPLLGGIFGGDASDISLRATMPQFVQAEREHGSLILSMRSVRRARAAAAGGKGGGKAPSAFVTLRGGVIPFVEAIAARARRRASLRTGATVKSVLPLSAGDGRGRFVLEVESAADGPTSLVADAVLLASQAHVTAKLVEGFDAAVAGVLGAIPFSSSATVFFAFRRADVAHPLDGTGFLVPRSLGRPVLASTWVSSKWAHRAPEGHVLLRVFVGGQHGEGLVAKDDATLVATAAAELSALMGLTATPVFTRVFRFERASAQPRVGHLGRMRALKKDLGRWPGLVIAGGGIDGIGIPECVRQGEEAAAALLLAAGVEGRAGGAAVATAAPP